MLTAEQMQEMAMKLGPVVAAQITSQVGDSVASKLFEQMKGQRDQLAPLMGGKSEAAPVRTLKDATSVGAFVRGLLSVQKAGGSLEAVERVSKTIADDAVKKALQQSVFEAAGVLVPVQTASELIEFLRPALVMNQVGARVVQFKGELHIGRQDGTTSFQWIGESQTVAPSQPKFGKVILKEHKAMGLVYISNQLLRNPGFNDGIIGEDFRDAAADFLDDAALNADGQGNAPLGLLRQIDPAHSFARAGTAVANYIADIDKLIELPLIAHVRTGSQGILIHPTRATAMLGLRDSAGWVYRNEMLDNKTIRGVPYVLSTRVDSSKIVYGADWKQAFVGICQDWLLSEHDTRAEYDETVLRAIMGADYRMRQKKAFAEITGY